MQKTIHSKHGKVLREAIKNVREKANLKQRELCRFLGREPSFISKCELGERRVDLVEFYWICAACGANPEEETQKLMKTLAKLGKLK